MFVTSVTTLDTLHANALKVSLRCTNCVEKQKALVIGTEMTTDVVTFSARLFDTKIF